MPSFNTPFNDSWEWVEQFLPLEWQRKYNERSGSNLDRYWIRRTGRCSIRYFDKVLEEDYQAIYSVDVSRTLTVRSLYKVATTIRVLVRRYTGGQELRYA